MEQDEFTAFEHDGWEKVAEAYKAHFGQVTRQSNGALLDAVDVRAGQAVLDVASGPGYVARRSCTPGRGRGRRRFCRRDG